MKEMAKRETEYLKSGSVARFLSCELVDGVDLPTDLFHSIHFTVWTQAGD